jgi:hypothetical protein
VSGNWNHQWIFWCAPTDAHWRHRFRGDERSGACAVMHLVCHNADTGRRAAPLPTQLCLPLETRHEPRKIVEVRRRPSRGPFVREQRRFACAHHPKRAPCHGALPELRAARRGAGWARCSARWWRGWYTRSASARTTTLRSGTAAPASASSPAWQARSPPRAAAPGRLQAARAPSLAPLPRAPSRDGVPAVRAAPPVCSCQTRANAEAPRPAGVEGEEKTGAAGNMLPPRPNPAAYYLHMRYPLLLCVGPSAHIFCLPHGPCPPCIASRLCSEPSNSQGHAPAGVEGEEKTGATGNQLQMAQHEAAAAAAV